MKSTPVKYTIIPLAKAVEPTQLKSTGVKYDRVKSSFTLSIAAKFPR